MSAVHTGRSWARAGGGERYAWRMRITPRALRTQCDIFHAVSNFEVLTQIAVCQPVESFHQYVCMCMWIGKSLDIQFNGLPRNGEALHFLK